MVLDKSKTHGGYSRNGATTFGKMTFSKTFLFRQVSALDYFLLRVVASLNAAPRDKFLQ
jgi:hypothetical protein